MRLLGIALGLFALVRFDGVFAQPSPPPPRIELSYADLADLAVAAPVAAHVRVRQAIALKGAQAASVPPGATRFFVEADIVSLIRGDGGLPARVRYLVDLPGTPKIKTKSEHLILAAPVAARAGELQLVAPDAQLPWTPALGDRVRAVITEAVAPGAAPRIIGIGKAFHVPGSLPGESETQLFLLAAGGQPISLTVLRRPGQEPRWAVALGEIVDEAAAPPALDTLLWYRLACTLPRALPPQSLADSDAQAAAAIRADYALVMARLGTCTRTRPRRG